MGQEIRVLSNSNCIMRWRGVGMLGGQEGSVMRLRQCVEFYGTLILLQQPSGSFLLTCIVLYLTRITRENIKKFHSIFLFLNTAQSQINLCFWYGFCCSVPFRFLLLLLLLPLLLLLLFLFVSFPFIFLLPLLVLFLIQILLQTSLSSFLSLSHLLCFSFYFFSFFPLKKIYPRGQCQ